MTTTQETTVKISKWLISEVEDFVRLNKKNMSNFPSKRNLVDRAVMQFLEEKGVSLGIKSVKKNRVVKGGYKKY